MMVVDPFAGPGGWDKGAESVGLSPIGLEMDPWACQTRSAAGLTTIRADVTVYPPEAFRGAEGLIASPPCPDWSVAGKKAGLDGETGPLMFEVPRWVEIVRPRWIACEQVPVAEIKALWRQFGRDFEQLGYRYWTGVLCAADYGVPQTRRRAFLICHRDRQPWPPEPTHAEDPGGFGGLKPWVSMAEALGWGFPDRPALTFCGGNQGGPDLAGGSGARRRLREAREMGVQDAHRDQRPDGSTQTVTMDRPAPSVTGKAGGQWVFNRPATTVAGDASIAQPGHHDWGNGRVNGDGIKVELWELGVLQGFPKDYPWQGTKTEQARQIGNAVPPPLAAAVLGGLI